MSSQLSCNAKSTVVFVLAYAAAATFVGADIGTTLTLSFFTLFAYFRYSLKIDKYLLDERLGATNDILGSQIGFAAYFGIATTVCALFGDQYSAFFGGIILWHVFMLQSDTLSQKLLKDKR